MKFSRFLSLSLVLTSLCTSSSVYGTQSSEEESFLLAQQRLSGPLQKAFPQLAQQSICSLTPLKDGLTLFVYDLPKEYWQDLKRDDLPKRVSLGSLSSHSLKSDKEWEEFFSHFSAFKGVQAFSATTDAFGDTAAHLLSQNLLQSLKEIAITSCKLTPDGANQIFSGLRGSKVRSLYISDLDLTTGDKGIKALRLEELRDTSVTEFRLLSFTRELVRIQWPEETLLKLEKKLKEVGFNDIKIYSSQGLKGITAKDKGKPDQEIKKPSNKGNEVGFDDIKTGSSQGLKGITAKDKGNQDNKPSKVKQNKKHPDAWKKK